MQTDAEPTIVPSGEGLYFARKKGTHEWCYLALLEGSPPFLGLKSLFDIVDGGRYSKPGSLQMYEFGRKVEVPK